MLADTKGRIGEYVNDVLVQAADYYVAETDWNTYALSLLNTALISPILPYLEAILLIQTAWDPEALLTK